MNLAHNFELWTEVVHFKICELNFEIGHVESELSQHYSLLLADLILIIIKARAWNLQGIFLIFFFFFFFAANDRIFHCLNMPQNFVCECVWLIVLSMFKVPTVTLSLLLLGRMVLMDLDLVLSELLHWQLWTGSICNYYYYNFCSLFAFQFCMFMTHSLLFCKNAICLWRKPKICIKDWWNMFFVVLERAKSEVLSLWMNICSFNA